MARRKAAQKRVVLKDPLFGSVLITKFINVVMQRGKKAVAEKIVYGALEQIAKKSHGQQQEQQKAPKEAPEKEKEKGSVKESIDDSESLRKKVLETLEKAFEMVRPTVELKSRRVGGATYQVPVEVQPERGTALAMRWIVAYAKQRGEKTMTLRLAGEILDAMQGRGGAIKKREEVHKMAKANQAFAHYRW